MSSVPGNGINWRDSLLRRSRVMANTIFIIIVLCTVFAVNISSCQSDREDETSEQKKFQMTLLNKIALMEDELSNVKNDFSTKVSKMEEEASRFSTIIFDLNNKVMQLEETIAQHQSSYGEKILLENNTQNGEHVLGKASSVSDLEVMFGDEEPKNSFSVVHSSSSLHEFNSTTAVDIQTRGSLKERGLQQSISSRTSFSLCENGIVLSPINQASGWLFNEDVSYKLQIIKGLSSSEALIDIESPQFKAACWILYVLGDTLQINDRFTQTYALFVFVFSTMENVDQSDFINLLLPDNVCNLQVFTCNDLLHITHINFNISNIQPTNNLPSELALLRSLESLELAGFDLTGTIPTHLALMTNLTTLKLTDNSLTGNIPSELGKLAKLEKILLSRNKLTGTIPTEISQCSQLRSLVLSQNSLGGTIPTEVAALTSLKHLEIMLNGITGTIPENFHRNYEILKLTGNSLSGKIPNQIWSVKSLKELWLGDNRLSGTISEHARNLTSLVSLGLDGNHLTGTIPDIFDSLENLRMLLLFNNTLIGPIPHSVWNEKMDIIDLHDNELTGTVPKDMCEKVGKIVVDDSPWFNDSPNVKCECCDEANCFISDSKTISVGELRRASCPGNNVYNIEYEEEYTVTDMVANETRNDFAGINVRGTKDFCFSPSGCYTIARAKEGEYEGFSYSSTSRGLVEQGTCDAVQICDHSIGPFHERRTGMNRLTQLVVSNLNIVFHDEDSPEYKAMCWLMTEDDKYFDYEVCDGTLVQRYIMALFYFSQEDTFDFKSFSTNHTCDWPGVECDANEKFIEVLRLDNVTLQQITSPGLLATNIKVSVTTSVVKQAVQLKGPLRKEFGRLSRLKEIYLDGNNFSGTIDSIMLSNSPELEVFSADHNVFEGEFPMAVLYSAKLKRVSMYGNRLIGTIEDSTKYSRNLEYFNLGKNLLHGTIPSGFINCKKLEYFNVGKNVFAGKMPDYIGTFEGLSTLKLNENKLSGQIPVIVSKELKILMLHSNILTGTIPSEISSLQKLEILSLHHNSLQGTIPKRFIDLKFLTRAQFHNNLLTGQAPRIPLVTKDNFAYITDCGKTSPLQCDTCTMCCDPNDADQKCRVDWDWNVILWSSSIAPVILTILIPIIMYLVVWKFSLTSSWFNDDCDPLDIYSEDSVYAFIFLPDAKANCVQAIITGIQLWMFIAFVIASNANSPSTDWEFTIQCFGDGLECANTKVISTGWLHLITLTLLHLGVDFIHGFRQLRKAIHLWDVLLLVSGFRLVCLSGLALSTSILYNAALAETDTQMIVNAVILLFINDLDEKTLEVLYAFCPRWTEEKIAEVRQVLSKKIPKNGTEMNEVREPEISQEDIPTVEKPQVPSLTSNGFSKEVSFEVEQNRVEEKEQEKWIGRFFSAS